MSTLWRLNALTRLMFDTECQTVDDTNLLRVVAGSAATANVRAGAVTVETVEHYHL